jgi:hypothetical protein
VDTGSECIDPADDLMSGYDWIADIGKVAVYDVQVGPAHAAGAYLDAYLARSGDRVRPFLKCQDRAARGESHRIHVTIIP